MALAADQSVDGLIDWGVKSGRECTWKKASGDGPMKGNVSIWDIHPPLRYLGALLHVSRRVGLLLAGAPSAPPRVPDGPHVLDATSLGVWHHQQQQLI